MSFAATHFGEQPYGTYAVAPHKHEWSPLAVRLLLAIVEKTRDGVSAPYAPACWLSQRPTSRNRSRWSRWTRRLASAGLIRRITELNRDRVRRVVVTPAGRAWIDAHCGYGAVSELNADWSPAIGAAIASRSA